MTSSNTSLLALQPVVRSNNGTYKCEVVYSGNTNVTISDSWEFYTLDIELDRDEATVFLNLDTSVSVFLENYRAWYVCVKYC